MFGLPEINSKGENISFKDFTGFFAEKPKLDKLLNMLESDLPKYVTRIPQDEEELKDAVYDLCRQLDPNMAREQLREYYLGVYEINFVFWDDSVGLEVKLVKHKSQLQKVLNEIVSHIPPFSNMFSHVIFVLYDVGEAIDNTDEIKKSIEGKGDNITMLVLKYGFPEA
jgi:hypothetical protein